MESIDQDQMWLLMAAVAGIAFLFGRASAGSGSSEGRSQRRMREREAAATAFSALSPSNQGDVDRLINDGKTIEAVKLVREYTGMGLRDSKDAVDMRRRVLKGSD